MVCTPFLPHAPAARPPLLMLDGHSSHYNPSVISEAAEEKIIIFCLPPHSSHETQPLDKGPFGPLKIAWKDVCHKFLADNLGKLSRGLLSLNYFMSHGLVQ